MAYPDRTRVQDTLVSRLYSTRVMENHDHSLEALDGCCQHGIVACVPLGGFSVLATRTMPFLT